MPLGAQHSHQYAETILFVGGSPRTDGEPAEATLFEPQPDPDDSTGEGARFPRSERDATKSRHLGNELPPGYVVGLGEADGPSPMLRLWKQEKPIRVGSIPLDLMFYNSLQPNLFHKAHGGAPIARRSGATVPDIQVEVRNAISAYRLESSIEPPRRNWRRKLRSIYEKHFGHSGHQRNNISLCMMVRANLGHPKVAELRMHWPYHRPFERRFFLGIPTDQTGVLLLGDLQVDTTVLTEMKNHFGHQRWDTLYAVQILHYGSRHSWAQGNARLLSPKFFVHCVPDHSEHHPHPEVIRDLRPRRVTRADYRNGVYFTHQWV